MVLCPTLFFFGVPSSFYIPRKKCFLRDLWFNVFFTLRGRCSLRALWMVNCLIWRKWPSLDLKRGTFQIADEEVRWEPKQQENLRTVKNNGTPQTNHAESEQNSVSPPNESDVIHLMNLSEINQVLKSGNSWPQHDGEPSGNQEVQQGEEKRSQERNKGGNI